MATRHAVAHRATFAVLFWYLVGAGGYVPSTSGHQYMCEGMIWSVPDPGAKEVWKNSLGSVGPFQNKASCEQQLHKNPTLWRGAVCVPENDSRVDPDMPAYDHSPTDAKTGEHIVPPDFAKRHPEMIKRGSIDINRPCPPGVQPPSDLLSAQQEAKRRRPELERQLLLQRERAGKMSNSAN
jgi:hypothetical protein